MRSRVFGSCWVVGFVALACTEPSVKLGDMPLVGGSGGGVAQPTGDAGSEPPSSQASYTYPGCPLEGGIGCPRQATIDCAAKSIRARHASCTASSDCVAVRVEPLCSGVWGCTSPIINAAEIEAFQGEVQPEIDRYCANATCWSAPSCLMQEKTPACVDGVCAWVYGDGGVGDAGETPSDAGAD